MNTAETKKKQPLTSSLNNSTPKTASMSSNQSNTKLAVIPLVIGGIFTLSIVSYFSFGHGDAKQESSLEATAQGTIKKSFEDVSVGRSGDTLPNLVTDSVKLPSVQEGQLLEPKNVQQQHIIAPTNLTPQSTEKVEQTQQNIKPSIQVQQSTLQPNQTQQQSTLEEKQEKITRLQSQLLEMLSSYDPKYSLRHLDPIIQELAQLQSTSVDVLSKAGATYIQNFAQMLHHFRTSLKAKCEAGEPLESVLTAWQYWYDLFKGGLTATQTSDPLLSTAPTGICGLLLPSKPIDPTTTTSSPPTTSTENVFSPTHLVQMNDEQSGMICNIQLDEKNFKLTTSKGTFNLRRKYLTEVKQLENVTLFWFHPFLKLVVRPCIANTLIPEYQQIKLQNGTDGAVGVDLKGLLREEMKHVADQLPSILRITNVNSDLSLCTTLPREFVVPKEIDDKQLKEIADFRIKNRLSMVVFASPDVMLIRTAQPLVTIKFRCSVDELFFKKCTFPDGEMYIVDLRPQLIAYVSGTEPDWFYNCTEKMFLDLVNVQTVRKAELAMIENGKSSNWLVLIKQNLEATWRLYDLIAKAKAKGKKITIAMHCMDGWDRTPQVITLLEILLDAQYRTMKGLAILVEKEWLASGHQFQLRIPKPYSVSRSREPSPVWSQMINMIWVWVKTRPELFEYGPEELLMVWREAYGGSFVGGGDADLDRNILERRRSHFWHQIILRKRTDIDPDADVTVLKNATPEIFYISDLTLLGVN